MGVLALGSLCDFRGDPYARAEKKRPAAKCLLQQANAGQKDKSALGIRRCGQGSLGAVGAADHDGGGIVGLDSEGCAGEIEYQHDRQHQCEYFLFGFLLVLLRFCARKS